jgi:hypothetical protein
LKDKFHEILAKQRGASVVAQQQLDTFNLSDNDNDNLLAFSSSFVHPTSSSLIAPILKSLSPKLNQLE